MKVIFNIYADLNRVSVNAQNKNVTLKTIHDKIENGTISL